MLAIMILVVALVNLILGYCAAGWLGFDVPPLLPTRTPAIAVQTGHPTPAPILRAPASGSQEVISDLRGN